MRILGRTGGTLKPFEGWSMQTDMQAAFITTSLQTEFIQTVQEEIRNKATTAPIRVRGEAGIGKTRLVFESVSADDIKPLVVYAESPEALTQSGLLNEISLPDSVMNAVLVVDECEDEKASHFWNQLRACGSRIKLITIFNEYGARVGEEIALDAPGLNQEGIAKIIEIYEIPSDQAHRYASLCEDSPRVAHVIGQNLRDNPEDPLLRPGNVDVWGRFIAGRGEAPQRVERRKRVLTYLSLFKRFGYKAPVDVEGRAIQKLIQSAYPEITWEVFQEVIGELKDRKILQGNTTLYLTPRALHIWLWREWWDVHGVGFDYAAFQARLQGNLRAWFEEMFRYAAGSETATALVHQLLSAEGPFADGSFLQDPNGAAFFLGLTEASPETALVRLEATLGTWSDEQVKAFRQGRDKIVWALERIAVWEPLFQRAARLLLKLAINENETLYTNNSTGTFVDLFSLGFGNLAPTEASPTERFPILEEAFTLGPIAQSIAIKSLSSALDIHMTRIIGAENQGLKKKPKLWHPPLWNEIHDAYKTAWKLLFDQLDSLPDTQRKEAMKVITQNAQSLGRMEVFYEMVVQSLKELSKKLYTNKNDIITSVIHILSYGKDTLGDTERKAWEDLRDELVGTDFSSQLNRYVGLDLFEDHYDPIDKKINISDTKIEALAEEAISDPSLLDAELSWLITNKARHSYTFAYKLGQKDKDFSLYTKLLSAYGSEKIEFGAIFFLSGYLRAMFERDKIRYEACIDTFAIDPQWQKVLPELVWRAGITDTVFNKMLSLVESGIIEVWSLAQFVYGTEIQILSEELIQKLICMLIKNGSRQGAEIGLSLFNAYYLRDEESQKTLPEELTSELLFNDALFSRPEETYRSDGMEDYHWNLIAKRFIELYPKKALPIAEKLLDNAGQNGGLADRGDKYIYEILNKITSIDPSGVWKIVMRNLDDKGFFIMRSWLSGEEMFNRRTSSNKIISLFPLDELWSWVDEDIEKRAWYMAYLVSQDLSENSLAKQILIRYGDREDVRRNLMANFSSDGWSGSASEYYAGKKAWLIGIREKEKDRNVLRWIDEYIATLDKDIERAKIDEERNDW
jgi:hypothetical protein